MCLCPSNLYSLNCHTHFVGLKLRRESQVEPLQSFNYALFPTMERSVPVGWQHLAMEDEEAQNIRLHELQKGEELPGLLEGFEKSYAKAVVLINTEDSYELSTDLVTSVKEVQLEWFPLLIVKKTDGEEILRCVERHDTEGIYARVDAENQVDDVDVVLHPPTVTAIKKTSMEHSSISEYLILKNKFYELNYPYTVLALGKLAANLLISWVTK